MTRFWDIPIKSHWFILLIAIYFTTVLNISFWRTVLTNLEFTNINVIIATISLPLVLYMAMTVLMALLTWPYISKPLIVVLLIVSSLASHMMWRYRIYIDVNMIRNVLQTGTREASDLTTLSVILWLLMFGIFPAILVIITKISYVSPLKEVRNRLLLITTCLIGTGILVGISYKEMSSFGRNNHQLPKLINPSNYLFGTFKYFKHQAEANRIFQLLDPNAKLVPFTDPHHTVFIIVLGETARAKNFSLNGYARETNPLLKKHDIVNFTNMRSCGTATAVSVPCMFSNMNRSNFNVTHAKYTENIIDMLQSTGYSVLWRENDGGCKGVCNRVPTEDMVKANNHKYCRDGNYCIDDALLDGLEEYLDNVKKDTVIVLHTMGSHGPTYYKRYPNKYKKFTPTCDTADIQNCTQEQIINTYDNTILYTDHIASSVIEMLKQYPNFESGMIYVSDHGESLGEKGVYLHGFPYSIAPEEQKHIPMILWMSDNMKKYDYINYQCLQKLAGTKEFSHDNIFHSLAGLLEVNSKEYNKGLDLFAPCRLKELPQPPHIQNSIK